MTDDVIDDVDRKVEVKGRKYKGISMSKSDTRVHVSFPEALRIRLEEIKDNEEIGSVSEVFRNAVKFYAMAYEEHKKGSSILIRHDDGSIERLRMFL